MWRIGNVRVLVPCNRGKRVVLVAGPHLSNVGLLTISLLLGVPAYLYTQINTAHVGLQLIFFLLCTILYASYVATALVNPGIVYHAKDDAADVLHAAGANAPRQQAAPHGAGIPTALQTFASEEQDEGAESAHLVPGSGSASVRTHLGVREHGGGAGGAGGAGGSSTRAHSLRYCRACAAYVPSRAEHCDDCDVCILELDHHCPWIGQCVGVRNLTAFYVFLLSMFITLTYAGIVAIVSAAGAGGPRAPMPPASAVQAVPGLLPT